MSAVLSNLPSKLDVCIYHDPCTDGFTSAFAVWKKYGSDVEFIPGCHEKGKADTAHWIEAVKDRHVLICDFSFAREQLEEMHAAAASLIVLDHHKTALDALGDLPYCYFDMTRSGALITWETLHGKENVPKLIQLVSDRDLWKNELDDSEPINTYIQRQSKSFDAWYALMANLDFEPTYNAIRDMGYAMMDCQASLCKEMAEKAVPWTLAGTEVWAANSSCLPSEVCEALRRMHSGPVAIYDIMGDQVKFSLRSAGEFSVADIAKKFPGGGGHRNASGFTVPIAQVDWVNKRLNP